MTSKSGAKFVDKWFRDRSGKLALYARPNLPIIIWFGATVAGKIVTEGSVYRALSYTALLAIIFWAMLEIIQGVNYFRRTLGAMVLILTIYSRLH